MRPYVLALFLLGSPVAWAQSPSAGQPDNAALLRAIEGISGRMKSMEDRLGRLEGKERGVSPRAVTPADSSEAQTVPGWFVKVIPWTPDGRGAPIGGFPRPASDFNFGLHAQIFPGQNRFIYQGESVFHPKEDGEYVFAMVLEPVAVREGTFFAIGYNCQTELQINGNSIFHGVTMLTEPANIQNDLYRPQYFTGALRMRPEPGKIYSIVFRTDCWAERNKTAEAYDKYFAGWQKNRFRITVKTPADAAPRPPRNDELYYVGRT